MQKIRAILLPIALVFAGIAIFEGGVRYGAASMRAYAIAGEINLALQLRDSPALRADSALRRSLASVLDNAIAAGAMQRSVWYLNDTAQQALDNVLAEALAARGEAVLKRFSGDGGAGAGVSSERAENIREALRKAMDDLEGKGGDAADGETSGAGETTVPGGSLLPGTPGTDSGE